MLSAKLSKSFPMLENAFSLRATKPSKKSNTDAKAINIRGTHPKVEDSFNSLIGVSSIKAIPTKPQIRLAHVSRLGNCLSTKLLFSERDAKIRELFEREVIPKLYFDISKIISNKLGQKPFALINCKATNQSLQLN